MTLKYRDFLDQVFSGHLPDSDNMYNNVAISVIDMKCTVNYGIGFTNLMKKYIKKAGYSEKDFPFKYVLKGNCVDLDSFSLINYLFIEKMYGKPPLKLPFEPYTKLAEELKIEI